MKGHTGVCACVAHVKVLDDLVFIGSICDGTRH